MPPAPAPPATVASVAVAEAIRTEAPPAEALRSAAPPAEVLPAEVPVPEAPPVEVLPAEVAAAALVPEAVAPPPLGLRVSEAVRPEPVMAAAAPARSRRPISVAGFVAAELRSIPAQWIDEVGGRRPAAGPLPGRALVAEGGAAVAVVTAPAPAPAPRRPAAARLAAPARVHLIAKPAAPIAEPPSAWPLAPAGIIRPCPLPEGALLFGPLSSSYVDGACLLRELGDRGHSGAVVTAGGGRAQAAILHGGAVLALVAAGRTGTRRLEGLRLPAAGQEEEHDLTVPVYRPEVAVALGQLVNLVPRFRRMHASFVRLPALLEHLAETRMTGGVRVTTGSDVGVLLLDAGRVLGAYTARHPALEELELFARLCAAGDAEIDVHAAPLEGTPPVVTVARLLG